MKAGGDGGEEGGKEGEKKSFDDEKKHFSTVGTVNKRMETFQKKKNSRPLSRSNLHLHNADIS